MSTAFYNERCIIKRLTLNTLTYRTGCYDSFLQRVVQALQKAEDLKGVLRKKYDEEFKVWKKHEAEKVILW